MGTWNINHPFANDEALDWAGDLSDLPPSQHVGFLRKTFDEFSDFEDKRSRGLNKEIRTPEKAAYLISLFEPPVSPVIEKVILDGIGKEDEDIGDYQALQLVAAAHVLLAAYTGDRSQLPECLCNIDLLVIASDRSLLLDAIRLLPLVNKNKILCRDRGSAWKRSQSLLAKKLAELAN